MKTTDKEIDKYLALHKRNREIKKSFIVYGMTINELEREFGLSKRQIRRILSGK